MRAPLVQRGAAVLVALSLSSASIAAAEPGASPTTAVRAGWAYGLGLELEYRPASWGVGVSGGYVPGLGAGGYAGVQWGSRPLGHAGWVAEAGVFRGVPNQFRVARAGFGLYALAGHTFVAGDRVSLRAVAGGGIPLGDPEHPVSFEILAKLTIGILF